MKGVSHHYPPRTRAVAQNVQKGKRKGCPKVARSRNVVKPFPGKKRVVVTDHGSPR